MIFLNAGREFYAVAGERENFLCGRPPREAGEMAVVRGVGRLPLDDYRKFNSLHDPVCRSVLSIRHEDDPRSG